MSLDWPPDFERTSESRREPRSQFEVSLADAVADLETELDRLDPDTWTPDIGNTHTKSNGLPLYNANPDDPGFVLRWQDGDERFAVACDHYENLRDNVREVGLWVKETRMRSNRGVETGDVAFAAARLPPGDEDEPLVAEPQAHGVLGISPDASDEEVKDAARKMKAVFHPDSGERGDAEMFKRVVRAEERMLDG